MIGKWRDNNKNNTDEQKINEKKLNDRIKSSKGSKIEYRRENEEN